MKLVDDAKQWWRWLSTWLLAMNGTFIIAYENIQPLKDYIPDKWFHGIVGALLILTFLGRVVKQSASANVSSSQ
jgi:hypothetical protein